MSRRKDRERFQTLKRLNSDYRGFRGYASQPGQQGQDALQAVACAVCGRKRNVPTEVAATEGERYICQQCRDEGRA